MTARLHECWVVQLPSDQIYSVNQGTTLSDVCCILFSNQSISFILCTVYTSARTWILKQDVVHRGFQVSTKAKSEPSYSVHALDRGSQLPHCTKRRAEIERPGILSYQVTIKAQVRRKEVKEVKKVKKVKYTVPWSILRILDSHTTPPRARPASLRAARPDRA